MSSIESKLAAECKIGMKWRIKKNHLQNSLNKFTNVSSKAFKASKIPGVEFCLSFQLDSKNPNDVNIFLYLNFEMTKRIEADFKVSVKSALFEKNITGSIYEKSGGYGGKFCARDQLFNPEKHYFVEEFMEIEFEGTLKARGIKRKAPESSDLVKILWKNDDDKDLTINVKNQQIKVHKWILCAKSSVFETGLNNFAFIEAQENKIEIPDFPYEVVNVAIKLCYEQDITKFINAGNALHFLRFADKYDFKELHNIIQTFLIEKLSESNVCGFANISITLNAHELREYCVCFLMNSIGKPLINAEKLNDEILKEIGRRSLFYTSE